MDRVQMKGIDQPAQSGVVSTRRSAAYGAIESVIVFLKNHVLPTYGRNEIDRYEIAVARGAA